MLTRDQALAVTGLILLGTIACLSPVHNDTWWHLAYGRDMAAHGGFGRFDDYSYTAAGQPVTNHQWLAQRLFFAVWTLGGLPLLTALCALAIVTGWVLSWRLARGPLADRLLVMGAGVAGSTAIWSIRPQVFTIALLPLVVTLLVRSQLRWIPLVILLWANLHGGVLLGLIVIAVWTGVAMVSTGTERRALGACLLASVLATHVTPLGLEYWPRVVRSLGRSQTNQLVEWLPPAFPPDQIFFWGTAAFLLYAVARSWRQLKSLDDRALAAASVVLLLPATRALRSIAPFLLVAAPTLTRINALSEYPRTDQHAGSPSRLWAGLSIAFALAAAAVIGTAWRTPWGRLDWSPMSERAARAIASCPAPIYNTFAGGGPIIWFVPSQKVFVDSRQDQFPEGLVASATAVESGGDYRPLFNRYGIGCAALPPSSPTIVKLQADGWHRRFADSEWVVLTR
jgi:hypothetical protein